jgi:deoxyribodipyrimidine photolyase-related protein
LKVPKKPEIIKSKYYEDAIKYVEKHFPNNFGILNNTIYPIDHESSEKWLDNFL